MAEPKRVPDLRPDEVVTATGCRVRVFDGVAWPHLEQEFGPGVMLMLDVPGSSQHAEVYLDEAAAQQVGEALLR